jgi:myo-inositol-1-phosphate synthase
MTEKLRPKPADGKLGILLPGLGAVSTTFIAGLEAIKKGIAEPIGSLTQMKTIRLGKRTDKRTPLISELVDLPKLNDLVVGGWDIFPENCYEAACRANVLEPSLLDQVKNEMQAISPMKAVFDKNYVSRLDGPNKKEGPNKMALAEQLIEDIENFKSKNNCSRVVMVWCASTEKFLEIQPIHKSLKSFEEAMKNSDPNIAPSMIYAYAALKAGVPFANGAPNHNYS